MTRAGSVERRPRRGTLGRADLLDALAQGRVEWFELGGPDRSPAGYQAQDETPDPLPRRLQPWPLPRPLPEERVVTADRAPLQLPSMLLLDKPVEPLSFEGQAESVEAQAWSGQTEDTDPERPDRAAALTAARGASTPLAAWSRLESRLRRALGSATVQPWRQPVDWQALVRGVASLKPLHAWPRLALRRWSGDLTVVLDRRSEALQPFVGDMDELAGRLRRRHGISGLSIRVVVSGAPGAPWQRWLGDVPPVARHRVQRAAFDWTPAPPDARMLVVSDLGVLTPQEPERRQAWVEALAAWRRGGTRITVLAPLTNALGDAVPAGTDVCWLGWSEDASPNPRRGTGRLPPGVDSSVALTTLLAQVAQIGRVYPPLLRALRRALPFHADAGTLEALVWNHPDVDRLHGGCEIRPEAFPKWEEIVRRLDSPLAQTAQRLRRLHHAGLPEADEHLQTLRFACLASAAAQSGFQSNIAAARRYLATELPSRLAAASGAQRLAWRGVAAQMVALALPAMRAADASLWRQVYRQAYAEEIQAGQDEGGSRGAVSCLVVLVRQGNMVRLLRVEERDQTWPKRVIRLGSAVLCSPDLKIRVGTESWTFYPAVDDACLRWRCPADVPELVIETGQARQAWRQRTRPRWATSWGWAERGHFVEVDLPWRETARLYFRRPAFENTTLQFPAAEPVDVNYVSENLNGVVGSINWSCFSDSMGLLLILVIGKVQQCFRYIEPGTFLMGSPESEPGRDSNESPRHQVTLTEGFWLADTACTQALWQAVMGDNPSHFKGDPNLPVDSVSWDDARRFLDKLNPLLPAGCEAVLPTEAQWEYACRAGTQTPYWFGESLSEEQAHVGQPWDKGRTVPVKARPANGWGLYQMHGNVWEWCEGSRREYKAEPVENPPDGQDRNSRALRGGSWFRVARLARSACRFGDHRDLRDRLCGFRFSLRSIKPSQGQVKDSGGAAVKGVLRPAEPGKGASGRGARDYEDRIFPDPFPPDCATAWGDDCFGLWFEFEVGGVTQRMRWIEPEKLFLHRDEIHVPALTINHGGYWIADTPCTTKLWVAVVGGDKYTNDTNLASDQLHVPTHPDEINNQFLTKLNQMIGKNFTAKLPTKSHLDFVCNKNTSEINSAKITDVGYKEKYFLRRLDASSCGLYNLYGSINEVTRDYSDGAKWRTSKSVRSAQATFEHDEHGFLVGQPMNLHPFRFIMDVHD